MLREARRLTTARLHSSTECFGFIERAFW